MIRAVYILIVIVVLSNVIGFSQNTNPFELKSRSDKQIDNKTTDNVFEIEDNIVDTITDKKQTNNPFELNNKQKKAIHHTKPAVKIKKDIPNHLTYKGSSDFLLWLFLFILSLIAILLSINRGLILKIIKVLWYYNHTNSLLRNFNNRDFLFYFFLFFVFILNLAIFAYGYIKIRHGFSGLDFFLKVFAVIGIIYIVKHVSILLFNSIFPSLKGLVMYNFTILLFNISLGLFLIPINLAVIYSVPSVSSFFLIFGLIIIAITYLIRLFRGFLVTYNYFSISIFHFFIYLCAFEILPLLFLYKYFIDFL